eukprot:gene9719-10751_t
MDDNTWVIILSTSRYWFNYRHSTNGFIVYRIAKALGVSDDHILFLDGTDVLNNARNTARGEVHLEASTLTQSGAINLLPEEEDVEIDYRGEEVTIELLRHILLSPRPTAGRTTSATTTTNTSTPSATAVDASTTATGTDMRSTPSATTTAADKSRQDVVSSRSNRREAVMRSFSPVLESNHKSNIFFYLAGHGGNEFFKFHDMEELDSFDLAMLIEEMKQEEKFQHLVIMMDTCQAGTMANHLITPNVTFIGSSLEGENSYAWRLNEDLGISTVDRFTYSLYDFFFSKPGHLRWGLSSMTFADLMRSFRRNFLMSTPVIIQTPGTILPVSKMNIMEFFKPKSSAEMTVSRLALPTSTTLTTVQHDKLLFGREMLKHLYEGGSSTPKMLIVDDSSTSHCGNLSFERPDLSWTVSHLTLVVVWLGLVCILSRWLTRVSSSKLDNYVCCEK